MVLVTRGAITGEKVRTIPRARRGRGGPGHIFYREGTQSWGGCLDSRRGAKHEGSTVEVFTVQKFVPEPEETRKICRTEPTRTRISFESGTRTCADPRNALNVLPGPDADPTIIRKLDPNPAGKTQTRLYPSRSAHIAQQMLLSQ